MGEKFYDLVIIGGGPAGMAAGIYSSRLGLKTVLITKDFGGQIVSKPAAVDNYPGFKSINGVELIRKMEEHLRSFEIQIKIDEVSSITPVGKDFLIETKAGLNCKSKSVIITSGAKAKPLDVPGEEEFSGRGVSYCAVCDGPIFKDKTVAIVGGGNAGFETAVYLSDIARQIYILEYASEINAFNWNKEAVEKNPNVQIILNAKIEEIKGGKFVEELVYEDLNTNSKVTLPVQGVFIEVGYVPTVGFIQNLVDLNNRGEIIVDPENMKTKTPGLFAAGDVTSGSYKQIVISAGEGAKAVLSAHNYLKKQ